MVREAAKRSTATFKKITAISTKSWLFPTCKISHILDMSGLHGRGFSTKKQKKTRKKTQKQTDHHPSMEVSAS